MIVQMDEFGRRCDANCYDGRHKACHCICKGKNHGVGLAQALENEHLREDEEEETEA